MLYDPIGKQSADLQLPKTFRDFIFEGFQTYPDRIFMSSPLPLSQGIDAREHVTFSDTLEQTIRTAAWLRSKGLGVGSKVAIGGGNCTGYGKALPMILGCFANSAAG
jgi:hypothetical protein